MKARAYHFTLFVIKLRSNVAEMIGKGQNPFVFVNKRITLQFASINGKRRQTSSKVDNLLYYRKHRRVPSDTLNFTNLANRGTKNLVKTSENYWMI